MIDADWEELRTLPDGTHLLLRALRPSDADALRAGFERLSPESRYRRFLTVLPSLSERMLRYLTEVDGNNHFAIVAGFVSPDLKTEEGAGVARFVRLPDDPDVAEAAVTVVDAFQGKGIGKILLSTLVRAAAQRGIRKFRAEVLPSNLAIQRLLASIGAVERERSDEFVVYDIPIPASDDEHDDRLPPLFELLRHAASSVALVFRHWWFGRHDQENLEG
jgi:RimJ/RimL family protein N-acetyltransferase